MNHLALALVELELWNKNVNVYIEDSHVLFYWIRWRMQEIKGHSFYHKEKIVLWATVKEIELFFVWIIQVGI